MMRTNVRYLKKLENKTKNANKEESEEVNEIKSVPNLFAF